MIEDEDVKNLKQALSKRPGAAEKVDVDKLVHKVMAIKERQGLLAASKVLAKRANISAREAMSLIQAQSEREDALSDKDQLEDTIISESFHTGVGLGEMTLLTLQQMKQDDERTDYHTITDEELFDYAEQLSICLRDLCRANVSPLHALRMFLSCDDEDLFIEKTRDVELSAVLRKVFP